jgi:hypothetical protein
MSPIQSIVFMYNDKPWTIEANHFYFLQVSGRLIISLVEPLTRKEANSKGPCHDYHWPEDLFPIDRDLKLLQGITKEESVFDLEFDVYDVFGDKRHHHCGIAKITGDENIKIWLEETWSHSH